MDLEKDVPNTDFLNTGPFSIYSPVQEALNNVIILDTIFKESNNLKNCRLSCKKWNAVMLSQKPSGLILKINKAFENTPTDQVPQMDAQLAKKILINHANEDTVMLPDEQKGILRRFCQTYGDEVNHLKFDSNAESFLDLQYILENNLCPKLRCLSMIVWLKTNIEIILMPKMPNLEFLSVWFNNRASKNNKNFLQTLVKSSPNLKSVKYDGLYDIDFSENRKLRFMKQYLDADGNIDGESLKKTLTQTSHSLEKFRLDFSLDNIKLEENEVNEVDDVVQDYLRRNEEDPYNNNVIISFPRMPRLTELKVNFTHYWLLSEEQILDNLSPKFLPNLKHLSLSNKVEYEDEFNSFGEVKILSDLVKSKGSFLHPGVTKLSLRAVKQPHLLNDIMSLFPNLTSLEVHLAAESSVDILAKLLGALKSLKLKDLKIVNHFQYDIIDLIDALEPNYTELFEGLKRFYIQNLNYHNTDSLSKPRLNGKLNSFSIFEQILLHIKKIEGLDVFFHNCMFNAVSAQRILGFIADNKIPIYFSC